MTDSQYEYKLSRLSYAAVPVSALVVVMLMGGSLWFAFALVVPIVLAWWIHRLRTTVDADGITAVTARGETRLSWDDIAGVRFPKWSSMRAVTTDGAEVPLPAVSFDDLPQLSTASAGRLPDPFAAEREARLAGET